VTAVDSAQLTARDKLLKTREFRSYGREFELREVPNGAGGNTLQFNGYACVTDVTYEMHDWLGPYDELVQSGAFKKTLSEDCDVAFLVNHEGMTLARTKSGTLQLSEDNTGLHSQADLDIDTPMVIAIRSAIERGDIDEMSFAFQVMRQQWSPDYMQRDIIEVSLNKGDVSVVNYGANPFTADPGMSLRYATIGREARKIGREALATALRELRAGATLSSATMETLTNVLSLVASADDSVDEAQILLSDLMGVPNPDDADSEQNAESDSEEQKNASNLSTHKARAKLLELKGNRAVR
jgi:hypothetical protein